MPLALRPLHPDVGVEVLGCDLSQPLDDEQFQSLLDAYHRHSVVVVRGQSLAAPAQAGRAERLGGIGERVAGAIQERSGKEVRLVVLGHLLRGGSPTSFDRLAAMRFGTAAVRALAAGRSGVMVALAFPNVAYVALEDVAGRMKAVPLDCDTLQTARDLGICFGD